jgi:hypothetical protein
MATAAVEVLFCGVHPVCCSMLLVECTYVQGNSASGTEGKMQYSCTSAPHLLCTKKFGLLLLLLLFILH